MKFSVVIPAYNEEKVVAKAIASLRKQNIPRADFEIIVVDNNSTDKTSEIARKAGADKVLKETQKGTNFAREKGFEASEGTIVAFLDADSEVPTDWLLGIEKDLSRPGVSAVSGTFDYGFKGITAFFDYLYSHILMRNLDSILHFFFRRKAGVIIGGNFGAWRWAIQKIGGLPPLRFWGDDAAIAMLLSRKVGRVIFDPELAVKSSPRRYEKEGIIKLTVRYMLAYFKVYFSKEWR